MAHWWRRPGVLFLIGGSVGDTVDAYVDQCAPSCAQWVEFDSEGTSYRFRNEMKRIVFDDSTLQTIGASSSDFGSSRCTPSLVSCAQTIEAKEVRANVGELNQWTDCCASD